MLDQHPTSTLPIVGELLSAGVANLGSGAECAANEVEPDTFTVGSTIVAAFQVGRFVSGGGPSDIGHASSGGLLDEAMCTPASGS